MFRCDPSSSDVPVVGSGSGVDVGVRTQCGEALRWTPGGDAVALAAFLGLVVVEGTVYERVPSGALVPVEWLGAEWVLVKPPAGEWFRLSSAEFMSQWAVVAPSLKVKVSSVEEAALDEPFVDVEKPVEQVKKAVKPRKAV